MPARIHHRHEGVERGYLVAARQAIAEIAARVVVQSGKQLHRFTIRGRLPTGWHIEVSEVREALGRPGGALQVRILNGDDHAVSALEMLPQESSLDLPAAHAGPEEATPAASPRPILRERRWNR